MRIRITRDVVVEGRPALTGEVLDVDDAAARTLLGIGAAEQVEAQTASMEAPRTATMPSPRRRRPA